MKRGRRLRTLRIHVDEESKQERLPIMLLENFQKSYDTEKLMRLLGAKQGRRIPSASRRRIGLLSEKVKAMINPQLAYRIMEIAAIDRGGFRLGDGTRFKSPKMARALAESKKICCFLATVGPVVDLEVEVLMKQKRFADAYVLDAIGSMSAEHVVEEFYRRMTERQAQKGAAVTLRFSPGYCDWPLKEQRSLFRLFEAGDAPKVLLSDSCLMSPRKSVSGLFGLLPPGVKGAHPAYNPCKTCTKRDCIARRSN